MTNIAGNYNTEEDEIAVVKHLLKENNITYKEVTKHKLANAGDVLVTFHNGKNIVIEVKEESLYRIEKWGDLGIDYISSCVFKDPEKDLKRWKGIVHKPDKHKDFIDSLKIDDPKFKWGKVKYSTSDIWLFYAKSGKEYKFVEIYDGREMTSEEFLIHLISNCKFAVNKKDESQQSHDDKHESAVFYIKKSDKKLAGYRVNLNDYCK